MFKSLKRIVYKVPDLEKAKEWYSSILGSQPLLDNPYAVIFMIGNNSLSLIPCPEGLPEDNDRVATYWEVDDVDEAWIKLIEAGATPHTPVSIILNIKTARLIDPFGTIIGLTGRAQDPQAAVVEAAPSESALTVAYCRALAAHEDRPEVRGPDYMAELFIGEERRASLDSIEKRKDVIARRISSFLYGYFIARTAYIDQLFEEALSDSGTKQIVLLGAGYDTRACRFATRLAGRAIFELDAPPTQDRKISILAASKIQSPGELKYLPVNFKSESIIDQLEKAGFDKTAKTLFIWEGVTYYLTPEAFADTLLSLQDLACHGSILFFDYMTEQHESFYPGEPFLFWIGRNDLPALLESYGFRIAEHLDSDEMEQRFLKLRDGSLAERALPRFCFAKSAKF